MVGGPKNGGGTRRDLAKITQQAAPCRCGRTYGMPNSSAGGKAMRRKGRQGKWLQGRLHSQGGRQGRDEWKAARPALLGAAGRGGVGWMRWVFGAAYNTSAAGLRRIHAPQRAHRACYLTAVTVQGGSRGPARLGARPSGPVFLGPGATRRGWKKRMAGMAGEGLAGSWRDG